MSVIEIKQVTEVADAMQIEDVQRLAWGMDDYEILAGRFLHALQLNGACLYAAYHGDIIVGFVFGVLGTVEDLKDRIDQVAAARLQIYSAIMGVLAPYQGQGIGYRLKMAQREFALRIGVRLITWTYDPLESRNGYFNMSKLGVVSHSYHRDYHGDLGGINAGLPTDRLFVEWWITSNRVKGKMSRKRAPLSFEAYVNGGALPVNMAGRLENGLPTPPEGYKQSDANMLMVEIPSDFQEIKQQDMPLAKAWREHTREIFEDYFDRYYLITDMVRYQKKGEYDRSYYVLSNGDA